MTCHTILYDVYNGMDRLVVYHVPPVMHRPQFEIRSRSKLCRSRVAELDKKNVFNYVYFEMYEMFKLYICMDTLIMKHFIVFIYLQI
jgi:hypothetical protein